MLKGEQTCNTDDRLRDQNWDQDKDWDQEQDQGAPHVHSIGIPNIQTPNNSSF